MLRMKYVGSTMTNYPSTMEFAPSSTNTNAFNTNNFSPFPNNPNQSYGGSSSNFFQGGKTTNSGFNRVQPTGEDAKMSKTSSTSLRKSFNADEYMQSLRVKLGEKDYNNSSQSQTYTNNFMKKEINQQLMAEPNNYENSVKKEYERLSQQHLKSFTTANMDNNMERSNYSSTMLNKPVNDQKKVEPVRQDFNRSDLFDKEKSQVLNNEKLTLGGVPSKNFKSKQNLILEDTFLDDFNEIEADNFGDGKIGNVHKVDNDDEFDI